MFLVDTNVLVHAADADSPFHKPCRAALEGWRRRSAAWFLTWPVVYEFLRVTTHPRVMTRPMDLGTAWSFVEAVLASPGLMVLTATDRHAAVCAETIGDVPHAGGNLVHDLHTAILMREHGVRTIYTRDADFHRFKFLEVIDPVDAATGRT
jgi:toxin-antitoxin system PIN domain toxin